MADFARQYNYGSRLRHRVRIYVDGKTSDPTILQVYLRDPQGIQTGPFTPTKMAVGQYEYQKTYTSINGPAAIEGTWTISWRGQGLAEGAIDRQYVIRDTPLTS